MNNIDEVKNKIIYEDCLKKIKEFPDNCIDLIILDPPYITTNEKWDRKEIISKDFVGNLYRILKETGNLYCWCGIGEKSQSLIRWFPIFNECFYFKDLITWKKQRGIGMRKGWLYTREEIMWFVKDNHKFVWNIDKQYSEDKREWTVTYAGGIPATKNPFYRFTNVWTDITEAGLGTSPQKCKENRFGHFSPKPEKAIERIVLLHTKENDLILDPFFGSGTTGVVCKKLNRNFIGIEINKEFCISARKRIDG